VGDLRAVRSGSYGAVILETREAPAPAAVVDTAPTTGAEAPSVNGEALTNPAATPALTRVASYHVRLMSAPKKKIGLPAVTELDLFPGFVS